MLTELDESFVGPGCGLYAPFAPWCAMYRYLIHRIVLMIPTVIGVAIFVFFLMRLIPGDIVELRLSEGSEFSQEDLEFERARLGLNRPLAVQFLDWMVGLMRLDLGVSMWTGREISEEIWIRFPVSLQIALMATILGTVFAIPLGTVAALKQDTWVDYGVRIVSIAGLATPSFWLGILMILLLLITFQWSPPISYREVWVDPWYNLSMLIWPTLVTGYRYSAVTMRMTRSALLDVLKEDYIRTARAKGLLEHLVVNRHALKIAMLPVITLIGIEFAFLIGGLVVTEQVFNLNGIGRLFVQSVEQKDYPMVQGLVLLVAFVFVSINFLVDILYAALDARIRYH